MQSSEAEGQQRAVRVTRAANGRVFGGVCAGMPGFWGPRTNALRVLFVLAALCFGVGIVIYIACWLVIPAANDEAGAEAFQSVVAVAWATCGLVGLALLAAVGAAATLFGLGWVIVAIAALLAVPAMLRPTRVPRVAALAAMLALTLPAVAVALSPMRLTFQSGNAVVSPRTAADVSGQVFRSGSGTMLIDLRHTRLPASGTVPLRIEAGLRRTIVALPAGQCVKVRVRYDVHTFTGQLAALLSGRSPAFPDVVLFGRVFGGEQPNNPHGPVVSHAHLSGPTLNIDFSSQGGGLYVRDYPANVAPDANPNWPGFLVHPEGDPILTGEPRKVKAMMVRAWHKRHSREVADERYVDARVQGPCVA
jgi:phage shock protein PspC (stress-responsive transcriptional regulator)